MVVTRFAPSPTGSLHVGGLRTALFNLAYARKNGGKFILRIEDTDEVRSTDDSLKGIVRDLMWAGLTWDEGPSYSPDDLRGYQRGMSGPYFQSQRKDIYNSEIDRLLQKDMAYERDGAIVFRMPKTPIVIKDDVLGEVTYGADQAQDMVIRKATGMPTYHFAVVVDDEKMGVTNIIRGQEHLQNTWKHMHLQVALDYRTPKYAHIPLIMNLDGSKMSKRQKEGQVNTIDFVKDGYTKEALLNFLALLGWSHPQGKEHFTLDEFIEVFDLKNIGKANAKFDYKKLKSFNSTVLKSMSDDAFSARTYAHAMQYQLDRLEQLGNTEIVPFHLAKVYKDRSETLSDPLIKGEFFYNAPQSYDEKAVKKHLDDKGIETLENLYLQLEDKQEWTAMMIDALVSNYAEQNNLKMGQVAQPLRVAITGNVVSPAIGETLEILGKDETLRRIKACLNKVMVTA